MRRILIALLLLNSMDSSAQNSIEKIPFDGIDQTWQNGSDRREFSVFKDMKYFTPSILMDINYTHSFNNPNDNTVVGSTALARNNEVQLSALHFGGDLYYKGARARIMTQFGTRSVVVPRNDPRALATAVAWMAGNLTACLNMGRRGRSLVETRHSWDAIGGQADKVLRAIVG